jgi:hypothetical protein
MLKKSYLDDAWSLVKQIKPISRRWDPVSKRYGFLKRYKVFCWKNQSIESNGTIDVIIAGKA